MSIYYTNGSNAIRNSYGTLDVETGNNVIHGYTFEKGRQAVIHSPRYSENELSLFYSPNGTTMYSAMFTGNSDDMKMMVYASMKPTLAGQSQKIKISVVN